MAQSTPADHTNSTIEKFGWTSVPHAQSALLKNISPWNPANYTVADIRLPDSELANQTLQYAKDHLPSQVFNHSMRVYYYGHAIAHHHLPAFVPSLETYFLTCLLHDIGTTPTNIHGTLMSFEFYGGFLALDLLQEFGARKEQAESVAEAIIRHQDLGDVGTITTVGQLIQLATLFDNAGANPTLISKSTIESVVKEYPRGAWSNCFADTVREELGLKPWAHSSAIQDFAEVVEGNVLMAPWDESGKGGERK